MNLKAALFLGLCFALVVPARATVSIEFQLGGVEVPAGSIGVLVADTADNEFAVPSLSPGVALSAGASIGDDVIIAVFSNSILPDWGSQKGFAEHFAVLDYADLGVEAGDDLTLHIFPDRSEGDPIRSGEPHLTYRSGDLDVLSSGNMGFTLPPDGGAYLLAALSSENGGGSDLAALDLREMDYEAGAGEIDRSLSATARHTYFFHLDQAGFLSLEGTGGSALRAELYGPDGLPVASSESGDFAFHEPLAAGFYTLVLLQDVSGTGPLAYGLEYLDADNRVVIPDVAVGNSLTGLIGNHLLDGGPGQLATLTSVKARRVNGYATVANRGGRLDALSVSGARGNPFCAIAYFSDTGSNVTAGLLSGAHRTAAMDSTHAAGTIRVQFTPNKRKLISQSGRKPVVKKRSFSAQVRANAMTGPARSDAATLRAKTR